jgi:Homing endonuclease associated repeat
MSREEIIAAIRKCARKLGRAPTRAELREMAGVSLSRVKYLFKGMTQALREAGFDPKGPGHLIRNEDLLLDWARLARKLGKLPPMTRYQYEARYTHVPFIRRYGSWRAVPAAFARFAREKRLEKKWKDVLAMIEAARAVELRRNATVSARERGKMTGTAGERGGEAETWNPRANEWTRRKLLRDRGLAGPPIDLPGLAHEPGNEQGVIFVFGAVADKLGFRVLTFQQGYPDCEAMREIRPGVWQRVRIEFEYESKNFLKHGHRRDGCDVIVCWRHNWPGCPKNIEVVELRMVVGNV